MPSRKKAIHAHCKSCSYDKLDKGTWRYQTEHCVITTCELYDFRPRITSKRVISQDNSVQEVSGTGGDV